MTANPQPGETWNHQDGGAIHVKARKPRMVLITRRPPGDSQAFSYWMRITTFQTVATGKVSGKKK